MNSECIISKNSTNIAVGEKGKRINFLNPSRAKFRIVRVDGCLIRDGKKSDYIVEKCDVGSVFIELKGSDIDYALKQLLSTISHDNCKFWTSKKFILVIVCSRVPSFNNSAARAKTIARKNGYKLDIFTRNRDISIENVL